MRSRLVVALLAAYGVIASVGPTLRAFSAAPDQRQRAYVDYLARLVPIRAHLPAAGGVVGVVVAASTLNLLPDDEHDLAPFFDRYALAPWMPAAWQAGMEFVVVNSTEVGAPAAFATQHDLHIACDLGGGVALLRRR